MAAELTARSFESRFRELVSSFGGERGNDSCVECERCTACAHSTFCRDSERLVRCHFCVRCALCTDSSHCRGSKSLIGCQHCIDSEGCSTSSYLIRCVSLTGCTYCFGCVGLSQRDFHVLNEPYGRRDYFAVTRRLAQELRIGV
jgi:hypothetical protein